VIIIGSEGSINVGEILELFLYGILFILIILIICLIVRAFMFIFGKKERYSRSVDKKLKQHGSAKDTVKYNDSEITTKDTETNWMNAVMTVSFVTASMKSANEHSNNDDTSESGGHTSDASSPNDSFDSSDSCD
jgi:Mg2+/citrate symporter